MHQLFSVENKGIYHLTEFPFKEESVLRPFSFFKITTRDTKIRGKIKMALIG
ncbi:uncharacterized protein ASCRUDRAFT_76382 [Ascoidea rubescens DSM 1968]|uniref:Uncharacterized protein n=1 Tax=Ascoidea rubescens DSM 1968 TaxID=1344418 RepID=A0A1D2VFZ9_9ASCO|nr:hypothetical protein ASCRUDRAFT_76382 [Ascoidea rubescens DSM 1968]ODV60397.1 hypothetical protein ASCRUDRAFT_76382 [Ascoidea rubescens DSM 1968]